MRRTVLALAAFAALVSGAHAETSPMLATTMKAWIDCAYQNAAQARDAGLSQSEIASFGLSMCYQMEEATEVVLRVDNPTLPPVMIPVMLQQMKTALYNRLSQ